MPRLDNTSFYLDSLTSHGETAKGVQWQSAQTQQLRFKMLRKLLPDDLSELTLVDAGCGFGDLHRYLVSDAMTRPRAISVWMSCSPWSRLHAAEPGARFASATC
jgi:hypothetical protein